jgi:hypothetical protein
MKKLHFLTGVVLLLCIVANVQQANAKIIDKGIKLGLSVARINTEYEELDDFLDSRFGFIGGAYMTFGLNRQFALQPEILYVTKGAEKDLFIISPEWSIDYLEFPILAKFNILPERRFRPNLFAGPAISFMLASEARAGNYSYDVAEGMKTIDFSLIFGGGFDYRRLVFDVRYTLGLANTVDAAKVNEITESEPGDYFYIEGDPTIKNSNLSFMIGFRF